MELTLDQALQKGIEAHKAGKAQEADRYYTAILKANPKHPDANHNMGVLAVSVGKVEAALPFFKTALEVNQTNAQFWLSYIDALIKLDRMDDARTVFEQAKSKGATGEAFDELEKNLAGLKINAEVDDAYKKSYEPSEEQRKVLVNLCTEGQYQEALIQASKLLELHPRNLFFYNIIGAANQGLGRLEEAIEAYKKAVSIKPDFAEAYNNMGIVLQDQGKLDEAVEACQKALSLKPDFAEAYNNMGITLQDQGRLNEAIKAYQKALSLEPNFADAYNNMGITLKEQGQLDEAVEACQKALSLKPDFAEAYYNTSELLKIFTPKSDRFQSLFDIDSKIKKLSSRMLYATSNRELINNLSEGLGYISEDSFTYKTPLSQIYKHNGIDLNCKRHLKIFHTKKIIPQFCFGCFKVQVEVDTFIDLIKLTSLFYRFNFEDYLTTKTIIELRPNIAGNFKGLVYCEGLGQAHTIKDLLDIGLTEVFAGKIKSKIKRGCSEYPLKFPDYGQIPKKSQDLMTCPTEWQLIENQFDQNRLLKPQQTKNISLNKFCLSDFYIIRKWIDYAKGIGDQSVEAFKDLPIIFEDVYELAKMRSSS